MNTFDRIGEALAAFCIVIVLPAVVLFLGLVLA